MLLFFVIQMFTGHLLYMTYLLNFKHQVLSTCLNKSQNAKVAIILLSAQIIFLFLIKVKFLHSLGACFGTRATFLQKAPSFSR